MRLLQEWQRKESVQIRDEKGCKNMAQMSYGAQMETLANILSKNIEQFKSLPADEARKKAHEDLVRIGLIDENENFTPPYVALMNDYV